MSDRILDNEPGCFDMWLWRHYYGAMKRTTVMLPPNLQTKAIRYARAHHMSLGALVRDSLAARVAVANGDARDPLFADDAVYDGPTPLDLARSHDRYLYDE